MRSLLDIERDRQSIDKSLLQLHALMATIMSLPDCSERDMMINGLKDVSHAIVSFCEESMKELLANKSGDGETMH